MLDSPEDVCAGHVRFEYPATFVLFSNSVNSLDQQGLLVHRHGSVEPDEDVTFSLRLRSWGYDTASDPKA